MEAVPTLKESELVAYDHAAAGHDGVLSDTSGELVIKPCTEEEIAFYESARDNPEFAAVMPTFMGKLSLSTPEQKQALANPDPMSLSAALQVQEGSAVEALSKQTHSRNASNSETLRRMMKGKKLDTESAVVLENVAAGFVKPNILDIKLGARLWADDAPPAKRQRLDKVASETTSAPLGFRVAGMRVWHPRANSETTNTNAGDTNAISDDGEYKVYDKTFGRNLTSATVKDGFKEFFSPPQLPSSSRQKANIANQRVVLEGCAHEVAYIQQVLEQHETRMYSASILLVYEGDPQALENAISSEEAAQQGEDSQNDNVTSSNEHTNGARSKTGNNSNCDIDEDNDNDDDDDDESDIQPPKIYAARLIDFAHASWTPGQGSDENSLHGIREVRKILDELIQG